VFVLNAYQSWLYNELLARWLQSTAEQEGFTLQALRYARGTMQFFGALPPGAAEHLHRAVLPVPGYDTVPADPLVASLLGSILNDEGIALSDLRVRQMHRIRVGGVDRAAVAIPEDLAVDGPTGDEMYAGRQKLALRFFLPRGSYATVLTKRLLIPRERQEAP
jgi:tRNA pseudouridine13 synthase